MKNAAKEFNRYCRLVILRIQGATETNASFDHLSSLFDRLNELAESLEFVKPGGAIFAIKQRSTNRGVGEVFCWKLPWNSGAGIITLANIDENGFYHRVHTEHDRQRIIAILDQWQLAAECWEPKQEPPGETNGVKVIPQAELPRVAKRGKFKGFSKASVSSRVKLGDFRQFPMPGDSQGKYIAIEDLPKELADYLFQDSEAAEMITTVQPTV